MATRPIDTLQAAQDAAYAYWGTTGQRSASLAVGKRPNDGQMIITALASKASGELVRVGITSSGSPIGADHPSMQRGIARDMLAALTAMPANVRDNLIAAHVAVFYA